MHGSSSFLREDWLVPIRVHPTGCAVKFEEYVRLHRIVTGVSSKTIWKMLSEGEPLVSILDHVPDEFYAWVKKTEKDLTCKYKKVRDWAERSYTSILDKHFDGSRDRFSEHQQGGQR